MSLSVKEEYQEFEKEMAEYRKEYLAAGLTEEDFAPFYEYCKAQVARNIAYKKHTQPLSAADEDPIEEDDKNPLYGKFLKELSNEQRPFETKRFWWLDVISDENLLRGLLSFTEYELELIDLSVYQGYTQEEIATITGKTQPAVCQKLQTLKKKLKKYAGAL